MKPGDRIFYAEYGHGAREGRVVRTYAHADPRMGERVIFRDSESGHECDYFASGPLCGVFTTRAAAEKSLALLDDPRPKLAPARRQTRSGGGV